jgi:hypothetical protein
MKMRVAGPIGNWKKRGLSEFSPASMTAVRQSRPSRQALVSTARQVRWRTDNPHPLRIKCNIVQPIFNELQCSTVESRVAKTYILPPWYVFD